MDHFLRDPLSASAIAAAATMAYIYVKSSMNKENLPNSAYFKPAFLVGLLVYFIVSQGIGSRETISSEPF